jgi:hypothetical protein
MFTSAAGRLGAAAIATVAGLAVLAPAAQAAERAPADTAVKLTAAGYTKYLTAQGTPEAKQVLKRFLALGRGQQTVFLKDLQDRRIYQAFQGRAKGTLGKSVSGAASYNKEVRFVSKATSVVTKDKNRTATVRFTVTEQIFGIPVTSGTITVSYPTAGQGTKKLTASAKVTNLNAAVAVKGSGFSAKGNTAQNSWVAVPQVKSFGKPVQKKQQLSVDRAGFVGSLTTLR